MKIYRSLAYYPENSRQHRESGDDSRDQGLTHLDSFRTLLKAPTEEIMETFEPLRKAA